MLSLLAMVVAICLGAAVAGIEVAASMRLAPPRQHVPGQMSPEELRTMLDASLIFYEVAYTSGWLVYRVCGAHRDAAELKRWSRQHLGALNLMGGCWLTVEAVLALTQGSVRPSLLIGPYMTASGIYVWWSTRRDPSNHIKIKNLWR